jgi:formylglycine-generating enzyme required for sulfatase activity
MGSAAEDRDADPDERPARDVELRAYCMDRTEVTVASYGRCVAAGACSPASTTVVSRGLAPADVKFWSRFCNAGAEGRAEHPINCVDWKQAGAYCRWTGGRLPTEAEWEHAARGSDGRTYPWGNDKPNATRLNACGAECGAKATALGARAKVTMYDGDDGAETTAPVGRYPQGASPFGIQDMAGNVWEWTADGYAPYDPAATDNPTHEAGPLRVVRGGHWLNALPQTPRAANRDSRAEDKQLEDVGFRCVSAPGA